jgi:hypothetical protein
VAEALEDRQRGVVRYYHDEALASSAEGALNAWHLKGHPLCQKKLKGGASFMFSELHGPEGLLQGAGVQFEVGREGTWNNNRLVEQACALCWCWL